ncbi:MAG: hypothetical protein ACOX6U_00255 [Oscillospiraceae bacterium]
MAEQQSAFFTYKGKPLVRKGDTIYYGSMGDDYVVMLNVQSHTKEGDLNLADNVTVQLMHTDTTINPMDIVVKKAEKKGLYQALDIASIWLERALEGGE